MQKSSKSLLRMMIVAKATNKNTESCEYLFGVYKDRKCVCSSISLHGGYDTETLKNMSKNGYRFKENGKAWRIK